MLSANPGPEKPDAGDQLGHGERLDEIVVSAGIEPVDAVLDRIARRQNETWNVIAVRSQLAKKFEAVAVGQG